MDAPAGLCCTDISKLGFLSKELLALVWKKSDKALLALNKQSFLDCYLCYFSTKTYFVGTHSKHLVETLQMSPTKNVFEKN